ncbi:MAG: HlyC/CorC family transporter [Bacteroidia bacterium]|nr:HlyC/CorC family transporter [Bacteroidia bacterium]
MNLLIIILVAILLLTFFSGMETAYISANKLRLELDKNSNPLNSKVLKLITADSGHYSATILIGNLLSMVIYGIAITGLLGPFFREFTQSIFVNLLIQTLVAAFILLVFAEFIPKTVFRIYPNAFLNIFAFPLAFFHFLFYPVTRFSIGIINLILKKNRVTNMDKDPKDMVFSRVDLDELVTEPDKKGFEKKNNIEKEVKLFKNALDFSKVKLREIMVPRPEIEMLEVNADIAELKQKFVETGFSRILIYENNIDNIIGYVASSIIFQNPESIKPYIKNLLIVPETMPANKLLSTFIREHRSIAIVVDEFGGTSGMVTSEDILEEIFGEIEDEHDTVEIIEKKLNENEYIFSGRAEIDLLNEKYSFNLPENEEFETLAGLILYQYESIPKINTEITINNYQLRILKASNTKIELVKLTLLTI